MKQALYDHLLVTATTDAVEERRAELKEKKDSIIKFSELQIAQFELSKDEEWKTIGQITPHELIELGEIEKELRIIENLMIKTNQKFTLAKSKRKSEWAKKTK